MQIPLTDMLKSIPGAIGIRLEEELPYTVIQKVGEIEIRHYDPFSLGQVRVSGDYEEAMDSGFRQLASFIFGKNETQSKTSMTTPVFMDELGPNEWMMSFYLAPDAQDLIPVDSNIEIVEKHAKDVAVYSYSGTNTLEEMREAKTKLLQELSQKGLGPVSDVWWAQYDQPFSLLMTKRNEALVKVNLQH